MVFEWFDIYTLQITSICFIIIHNLYIFSAIIWSLKSSWEDPRQRPCRFATEHSSIAGVSPFTFVTPSRIVTPSCFYGGQIPVVPCCHVELTIWAWAFSTLQESAWRFRVRVESSFLETFTYLTGLDSGLQVLCCFSMSSPSIYILWSIVSRGGVIKSRSVDLSTEHVWRMANVLWSHMQTTVGQTQISSVSINTETAHIVTHRIHRMYSMSRYSHENHVSPCKLASQGVCQIKHLNIVEASGDPGCLSN